jgi:S1-C subfamily serine protease
MSSRLFVLAAMALGWPATGAPAQTLDTFGEVNRYAQERTVKIYGAGGLQQLEAYQSGVLVSAEGHVATMASVVLDQDSVTVLLGNGLRLRGDVVGADPLTDVAVLKLDAEDAEFPHFDLATNATPYEGMRVLAFSNLYNVATGDEPVSVLHGVVTAIAPLEARRGAFTTRYRDEVYIVDAAINNPGAAGGVVLNMAGQPLGMIGKEVRSELTGTWLNYALPWQRVADGADRILSGDLGAPPDPTVELPERFVTFASLGFRLVPSVVPRTPPYIDVVLPNSPAASAMLEPDDLVIAIGGMRTGTRFEVEEALRRLPIEEAVRITLLRGNTLIDIELTPVVGGAP